MIDILIVTVPGTITNRPPLAPAVLKASVIRAGFICQTIDFNARFNNEKLNLENFTELEKFFIGAEIDIANRNYDSALKIINDYAKEIIKYNPRYVGISVFTYQNRVATELLCLALKKMSKIKIVIGGQGVTDSGLLGKSGFGQRMLDSNCIDFYIRSEGEMSLVELLKGNATYPGINSHTFLQINDLDSLPHPDYTDYDFNLYDVKRIPMLASRGCVRSCTFCDVHEHWKYRFRNGDDVADEMITHFKNYQITDFTFGDSLINGNLKEFKKFIKIIANYNNNNNSNLKWTSQFIIRNGRQIDEIFWKTLAQSGAHSLSIGIETGSDSVRYHMNKKFSNKDIDYTLDMFNKYGITCNFLMITGYPTETQDDYQATLDMFTKYKNFANSVIISVDPGNTLGILPGTPLYYTAASENIILDNHEVNWIALNNPMLTVEEKLYRRQHLVDHLLELGYNVPTKNSSTFQSIVDKKE